MRVSELALGTVELGMDYGIAVPGEFGRPTEGNAIRIVRQAVERGVNLFDTAPAYGESERVLGMGLAGRDDCYIATKVTVPSDEDGKVLRGSDLQRAVRRSLESSLRALGRETLDVVQIHNATPEVFRQGDMADALLDARTEGLVRFLGASVYGEAAALAVIDASCFDVLQVAYNVLDQRMARRVLPAASRAGVGVVGRSVLLKGALSAKAQWLPEELIPLKAAAKRAMELMAGSWDALPAAALRFCLSAPEIDTVLIGVRTVGELGDALAAVSAGPLAPDVARAAAGLVLDEERLVNPSNWPLP